MNRFLVYVVLLVCLAALLVPTTCEGRLFSRRTRLRSLRTFSLDTADRESSSSKSISGHVDNIESYGSTSTVADALQIGASDGAQLGIGSLRTSLHHHNPDVGAANNVYSRVAERTQKDVSHGELSAMNLDSDIETTESEESEESSGASREDSTLESGSHEEHMFPDAHSGRCDPEYASTLNNSAPNLVFGENSFPIVGMETTPPPDRGISARTFTTSPDVDVNNSSIQSENYGNANRDGQVLRDAAAFREHILGDIPHDPVPTSEPVLIPPIDDNNAVNDEICGHNGSNPGASTA